MIDVYKVVQTYTHTRECLFHTLPHLGRLAVLQNSSVNAMDWDIWSLLLINGPTVGKLCDARKFK